MTVVKEIRRTLVRFSLFCVPNRSWSRTDTFFGGKGEVFSEPTLIRSTHNLIPLDFQISSQEYPHPSLIMRTPHGPMLEQEDDVAYAYMTGIFQTLRIGCPYSVGSAVSTLVIECLVKIEPFCCFNV